MAFILLPPNKASSSRNHSRRSHLCISSFKTVAFFACHQKLKLGRQGERIVAEVLEGLRVRGFGVLHDVPGDKFNLDHVVFSPHGIFVVETKTISKPTPDAQVSYDGTRVLVAGRQPTRDPIVQVKSAARWLQEMLKASTGKAFPVRGVVVYPGWYVESRAGNKSEVWVLNPKALAEFIVHQPQLLQPDEAQMALSCFAHNPHRLILNPQPSRF